MHHYTINTDNFPARELVIAAAGASFAYTLNVVIPDQFFDRFYMSDQQFKESMDDLLDGINKLSKILEQPITPKNLNETKLQRFWRLLGMDIRYHTAMIPVDTKIVMRRILIAKRWVSWPVIGGILAIAASLYDRCRFS